MCIFTGKVSDVSTLIGAWEAGKNEKGQTLQGIVYKNTFTPAGASAYRSEPTFRSRSAYPSPSRSFVQPQDFDWTEMGYDPFTLAGRGLAMVWPIPIHEDANVFTDVMMLRDCKHLAADMTAPFDEDSELMSKGISYGVTRSGGHAIVVAHGEYSVVIADKPTAAASAIAGVPADRQPLLKQKLFSDLEDWYPGWALVIACINAEKSVDADPFSIIWPTRHEGVIYIPTLDDHEGEGPDLRQAVSLKHRIAVGSVLGDRGAPISYQDAFSPSTLALLPKRVVGANLEVSLPNGDLYCRVEDVRNGRFSYIRKTPPGVRI